MFVMWFFLIFLILRMTLTCILTELIGLTLNVLNSGVKVWDIIPNSWISIIYYKNNVIHLNHVLSRMTVI